MQTILTLTNGVSFSLVAGAIIFVKFTNSINSGTTNHYATVTLNINSLGAKTFGPWSGSTNWGTANYGPGFSTNSNQHYPIIYSGSDYRIVHRGIYEVVYGDYGD